MLVAVTLAEDGESNLFVVQLFAQLAYLRVVHNDRDLGGAAPGIQKGFDPVPFSFSAEARFLCLGHRVVQILQLIDHAVLAFLAGLRALPVFSQSEFGFLDLELIFIRLFAEHANGVGRRQHLFFEVLLDVLLGYPGGKIRGQFRIGMIHVNVNDGGVTFWHNAETSLERPGEVTLGASVGEEAGIPVQTERLDDLFAQGAALHDLDLGVEVLVVTRIGAQYVLDIQHLHRFRCHLQRSRRPVNGGLVVGVDEIDRQYGQKRNESHPFVFEDNQEIMSPMQTDRGAPPAGSALLPVRVIGNEGLHGG